MKWNEEAKNEREGFLLAHSSGPKVNEWSSKITFHWSLL
jgi:hypothetical protein